LLSIFSEFDSSGLSDEVFFGRLKRGFKYTVLGEGSLILEMENVFLCFLDFSFLTFELASVDFLTSLRPPFFLEIRNYSQKH